MNWFEKIINKNNENLNELSEQTVDTLWEGLRPEAEKFFEQYENGDGEMIEEARRESLEGEEYFFKTVLLAVKDFVNGRPEKNKMLFFDIDETVGKLERDKKGEVAGTLLRPSLTVLLESIKKYFPLVEINFLTSRGDEEMSGEIDHKKHFAPIRRFLGKRGFSQARI